VFAVTASHLTLCLWPFLGVTQVILNLAKLVPYKGQYIEQVFDIKQVTRTDRGLGTAEFHIA
jgi:hypothetical protein